MALKIELKPNERIIIGESLIINDSQRTRLFIEGTAPILREKDILTPDTATTPCQKIYLAVQLMYLSKDIDKMREDYFHLVNDVLKAAPSTVSHLTKINNHILSGAMYKALKEARALIKYERTLLDNVQSGGTSLPEDQSGHRKSA